MKTLKYIIGEPGVGKTTLLSLALPVLNAVQVENLLTDINGRTMRIPIIRHQVKFVEIGERRSPFGGTDTLSMAAQPYVLQAMWKHSKDGETWIAEGDRLANAKFFGSARAAGWQVQVILIHGCAEAQRISRAEQHHLDLQSASWVAGRVTKCRNLLRSCDIVGVPVTVLANVPNYPATSAEKLRRMLTGSA